MGLRKTVQQQQGRAVTANNQIDLRPTGRDAPTRESLEHSVVSPWVAKGFFTGQQPSHNGRFLSSKDAQPLTGGAKDVARRVRDTDRSRDLI
jgi:hypothetical protein